MDQSDIPRAATVPIEPISGHTHPLAGHQPDRPRRAASDKGRGPSSSDGEDEQDSKCDWRVHEIEPGQPI